MERSRPFRRGVASTSTGFVQSNLFGSRFGMKWSGSRRSFRRHRRRWCLFDELVCHVHHVAVAPGSSGPWCALGRLSASALCIMRTLTHLARFLRRLRGRLARDGAIAVNSFCACRSRPVRHAILLVSRPLAVAPYVYTEGRRPSSSPFPGTRRVSTPLAVFIQPARSLIPGR